jgi:hypothetical protein
MVRVAEEEFRKDTTKSLLNGIVADTLRRLGIETKPEPKVTEFLNQWENPELFGKLQALDWMADDEAEEREREDNNEPQPNRFSGAMQPQTAKVQTVMCKARQNPDASLTIQGGFLNPL